MTTDREIDEAIKALAEPATPHEGDKPVTMSTCGGCGGPHRFDTSVPSVLWNRVVRAQGLSDYLCLPCIVRAFAKAGVSFPATLWGDGFDGLPIAVEINGAVSTAAREVSEQNNHLRGALSEIMDRARDAHTAACRARPASAPPVARATARQDALLAAAALVLQGCKDHHYHGSDEPCGICTDHAAAIRRRAGFELVTDLRPIASSTRRASRAPTVGERTP